MQEFEGTIKSTTKVTETEQAQEAGTENDVYDVEAIVDKRKLGVQRKSVLSLNM